MAIECDDCGGVNAVASENDALDGKPAGEGEGLWGWLVALYE